MCRASTLSKMEAGISEKTKYKSKQSIAQKLKKEHVYNVADIQEDARS